MLNIKEQDFKVKWDYIDKQYNDFINYKINNPTKPLVFFGAGAAGSVFLYDMKIHGIDITCFCDNDINKHNTSFCGRDVYSYDKLREIYKEYDIVLSDGYINEKLSQLKQKNENNTIFCIEKTITYNTGLSYQYYLEHQQVFEDVYDMLCDEKSKSDMKDFLLVSITGDVNLFTSTARQYTYFDKSVFTLSPNEVYVDIGAYRGETISGFINYCNNSYNKIVAIEADNTNYEYLEQHILTEKIEKIDIYKYAAWDKIDVLQFDSWESAISRVEDPSIEPPHKQIKVNKVSVNAINVDKLLLNETPTYIKMDIEGSEMKALQGLSKSIGDYKPKLAISVYHKKQDLLEIPFYLKSLVPEYKFYLRNYGIQGGDTVLYAVI